MSFSDKDLHELLSLCTDFRHAIEKAKMNHDFNGACPLKNFPYGSCGYTCELLHELKTIIRGYCSPPCGISWYDSDSIDMASILLPRNAISILIIIRDKSMAHTHLLMMTS